MMKMVKHTMARSFKISKFKNLLEKPSNAPEVTTICDISKSKGRHHHSFKLGSKLKYLNSDQLLLSKRSELRYFKSAPKNVEQKPDGLMTNIIMFLKAKGRKQYICCFLQ